MMNHGTLKYKFGQFDLQGYSSLAVALVLPEGGRLVACDRDERSLDVARKYFTRAGVLPKVRWKCRM